MSKPTEKRTKSLTEILNQLEDFSVRHNQLNDFGYGKTADIEQSRYLKYPALWVMLVDSRVVPNQFGNFYQIDMNFRMVVMDQLDNDHSMKQDVQSHAGMVLNDLIAEFQDHPFYQDQFIRIDDDVEVEPFEYQFKSYVTGQVAKLTISVPFTECYSKTPVDEIGGYTAETLTKDATSLSTTVCEIVEDCSLSFNKDIVFEQDIHVMGSVSATTFYGDGSNLTGLKATFSGLTDTNLSGVTDGQIAIYDSSNNEWIPGNVETTFSGLTDTSFTGLTDGDIVVYNSGTTRWENVKPNPSAFIDAYDTDDAGTSIGTDTPVTYDTVRTIDSNYFTLNDPDIEILQGNTYQIYYQVNTRAGGRATTRAELHLDQGSGFSKVPGTDMYFYNRTSNNGWNSAFSVAILELNAGDKVKVLTYQNSGSGSELESESSIMIGLYGGQIGPKGDKGDKGDTGSLSGTVFSGGFQMVDTVINGASGTIITDLSQSNVFNITLTGNTTLDYNNLSEAGTFQWIINQDSTGGHDLSYASNKFQAPGGQTPDISQTPNSKTLLSGIYDDVDGTMIIFNSNQISDI